LPVPLQNLGGHHPNGYFVQQFEIEPHIHFEKFEKK
jgi:hypothetical protein